MKLTKIIAVAALALLSSASFAGERVKLFDDGYLPQGCKRGDQAKCFNPNNKRANELFAQGRLDELAPICNDVGYYHSPKVSRELVEQCAKMGSIRMMGWMAYIYRLEGNYEKAMDWAIPVREQMPSKERFPNGVVAPQKESRVAWGELCYASLYGKGLKQSFEEASYFCNMASSRYKDTDGWGTDERYDDVTLVWFKEALKGFQAEEVQRQKEDEEYREHLRVHLFMEANKKLFGTP